MATVETQAEVWDVPDDTYFSDYSHVSNTALGWFIQSPELYHGIVSGKFPAPTFEAAAIGKAAHSVLLEGAAIESVAVLIPRDALSANGSRAGSAWKSFEAENAGKLLLKQGEFIELRAIVDAVRSDAVASRILGLQGPTEQALRWTCRVSGLKRKAKLDKQCIGQHLIVDLKTTQSAKPRDFAKSCETFGYFRQLAFYQDAYESLHGVRPSAMFIAVEKSPPYSCRCFDLHAEWLEAGQDEVEQKLLELSGCIESGVWREHGAGTVVTLSRPRWAAYASEWEL